MTPIVEVRASRRTLRLRRAFVTALRRTETAESVVVEVVAGDGSIGVGDATPVRAISGETLESVEQAVHRRMAPALIGLPADDLPLALRRLAGTGRGDPAARAGVDLALHDLACRRQGTSLHRLLGVVAAPVRTDMTVSVAEPEQMVSDALEAVGSGFATVKLKVGGPGGHRADVERVLAVAGAVGSGVELRIDANQAWSREEAVAVLAAVDAAGVGLEAVEQPVAADDLDGLRWVRERSGAPIVADEAVWGPDDVRAVARAGAASVVNVKLMKCGGLAPARETVRAAEEAGLGWMVGCMMESPRGVAAAAVLAGGAPDAVHDLDAGWWLADRDGRLRYEDGRLTVAGDGDEER